MREMPERFHLLFVERDDEDDYPDCVNVCFWFVPRRLRSAAANKESREWKEELGRVSKSLKESARCCWVGDAYLVVEVQLESTFPTFSNSVLPLLAVSARFQRRKFFDCPFCPVRHSPD